MEETIKVYVIDKGRKFFYMRYIDPMDGRPVERSTKETKLDKAERAAGVWQDELRTNRYAKPSRATWAEFREKYEMEVLSGMATDTQHKVNCVLDIVERVLNPQRVRDITAARISHLQSEVRKGQKLKGRARRPCSQATVDSYLRTLRAALSVAVDWGYLPAVPKVRKETRAQVASKSKGRPLVGEEFDRLIAVVPKVTGEDAAEPWRDFLNGLWLSGLRLGEAIKLYWRREDSPTADCILVDLDGRRPMLRIPAAVDKGKRDRLLPITPDFAEFLSNTPAAKRRGPVFDPTPQRRHEGNSRCKQRIGSTVAKIGRKAGIVVNDTGKCATCHDLRRSFGQRWAARVMPHILMQLMRHQNIDTTMRYYAGRDAEAAADVVWATLGDTLVDTSRNRASEEFAGIGVSADCE